MVCHGKPNPSRRHVMTKVKVYTLRRYMDTFLIQKQDTAHAKTRHHSSFKAGHCSCSQTRYCYCFQAGHRSCSRTRRCLWMCVMQWLYTQAQGPWAQATQRKQYPANFCLHRFHFEQHQDIVLVQNRTVVLFKNRTLDESSYFFYVWRFLFVEVLYMVWIG